MMTDWQIMLASNQHVLIAFILGLLMLGAAILFFRSLLFTLVEVILLACLLLFGDNYLVGIIISVILYASFLLGLYRLKTAIDWNYKLTMEKIHKREPEITKASNGSRGSFF